MHVLLDTNIYLSDITLGKPEHEALRNYLQTSNSSILMPHIVKSEIDKNIATKAQSEISKLSQFHSVSLGLITSPPSADILEQKIKEKFDQGLSRTSVIDAGYGDLSLETVTERSLAETPPFKSKGRGFRDALIWYSLLEYLRTHPEDNVAFITDNSQDFGVGDLKPELMAELAKLGYSDRVVYFHSLSEFLTTYSEPIAFITEEFVESNVNDYLESYGESISEHDLDIEYPSTDIDVEWSVTEVIHEESTVENFYIYRTTPEHYYVYVEASMYFYVGLEGYGYEWEFDHMNGDYDYHVRRGNDSVTTSKYIEIGLKIDRSTHEVEIVDL